MKSLGGKTVNNLLKVSTLFETWEFCLLNIAQSFISNHQMSLAKVVPRTFCFEVKTKIPINII